MVLLAEDMMCYFIGFWQPTEASIILKLTVKSLIDSFQHWSWDLLNFFSFPPFAFHSSSLPLTPCAWHTSQPLEGITIVHFRGPEFQFTLEKLREQVVQSKALERE